MMDMKKPENVLYIWITNANMILLIYRLRKCRPNNPYLPSYSRALEKLSVRQITFHRGYIVTKHAAEKRRKEEEQKIAMCELTNVMVFAGVAPSQMDSRE